MIGPEFANYMSRMNGFMIQIIGESLMVMKKAAEGGGMLPMIKGDIVKPVFRKFN